MTPRQAVAEHLMLIASGELRAVRNGRLDRGQGLPAATIAGISGRLDRSQSGYGGLADLRIQIDVWAEYAGEAEFLGLMLQEKILDDAQWREVGLLPVVAVEMHDARLEREVPEDGGDVPTWRYLLDVTLTYRDRFAVNV